MRTFRDMHHDYYSDSEYINSADQDHEFLCIQTETNNEVLTQILISMPSMSIHKCDSELSLANLYLQRRSARGLPEMRPALGSKSEAEHPDA